MRASGGWLRSFKLARSALECELNSELEWQHSDTAGRGLEWPSAHCRPSSPPPLADARPCWSTDLHSFPLVSLLFPPLLAHSPRDCEVSGSSQTLRDCCSGRLGTAPSDGQTEQQQSGTLVQRPTRAIGEGGMDEAHVHHTNGRVAQLPHSTSAHGRTAAPLRQLRGRLALLCRHRLATR